MRTHMTVADWMHAADARRFVCACFDCGFLLGQSIAMLAHMPNLSMQSSARDI